MPHEIIPVHKLELHEEIFDPKYAGESTFGLSDMQMQFLGIQKNAAKITFSEQTLQLLDEITKHEDEVLTATEVVAHQSNEPRKAEIVFRVPGQITDHDLLNLKTQGLIQGKSRAVKLTESGRIALRDYWLRSGNAFLEQRKKEGFELERLAGVRIAATDTKANSKFTRVKKGE